MSSTIKDIAKLAGVGISTVSRVVSNSRKVSDENREKVLRIVNKLNYKPNKAARDLVKRKFSTPTIGVVFPQYMGPFFYEMMRGIYLGLNSMQYNLMIFNVRDDHQDFFERIANEDLSGILVIANKMSTLEKKILKDSGTQYIYLDFYEKDENCIYVDNLKGGKLAASYLLSKNCEKIAYIGYTEEENQQQSDRFIGFKNELELYGKKIETMEYFQMDWSGEDVFDKAYTATKNVYSRTEADGIFYFCDDFAYGGLKVRTELNKKSYIIGYDDLPSSQYTGLTTIRQPARQIGYEGALSILNQINLKSQGVDLPIIQKCLQPELIIRNS